MALAVKTDLPRSPINYSDEQKKFNEIRLKNSALTSSGSLSYTSLSSGINYSSATGEVGLLSLLESAIGDSLITGGDWNSIQTEIDVVATDLDIMRTAVLDTGTVNAIVVNTEGTFDLTRNGNIITIIPLFTTTNVTVNISVDGQTNKLIKKANDSGVMGALEVGDIKKNVPVQLVWDSANDFFIFAPKGGAYKLPTTIQGSYKQVVNLGVISKAVIIGVDSTHVYTLESDGASTSYIKKRQKSNITVVDASSSASVSHTYAYDWYNMDADYIYMRAGNGSMNKYNKSNLAVAAVGTSYGTYKNFANELNHHVSDLTLLYYTTSANYGAYVAKSTMTPNAFPADNGSATYSWGNGTTFYYRNASNNVIQHDKYGNVSTFVAAATGLNAGAMVNGYLLAINSSTGLVTNFAASGGSVSSAGTASMPAYVSAGDGSISGIINIVKTSKYSVLFYPSSMLAVTSSTLASVTGGNFYCTPRYLSAKNVTGEDSIFIIFNDMTVTNGNLFLIELQLK